MRAIINVRLEKSHCLDPESADHTPRKDHQTVFLDTKETTKIGNDKFFREHARHEQSQRTAQIVEKRKSCAFKRRVC